MLFYILFIIVLFVLFLLANCNCYSKNVFVIYSCILLLLVAIFRFDVGYDYQAYYLSATSLYEDFDEHYELLSRLLIQLSRCVGIPCLVFILFGIPTYLLMFFVCSKTKDFQLSFFGYVFLFLLDSFGLIRQALAMSIIMCAILCIYRKQLLLYILLCVVASLFHTSALVMLPAYFIYHYISFKFMFFLCLSIILCFNKLMSFLLDNDIYTYYLNNIEVFRGGSFIRWFYICIYLILYVLSYSNNSLKYTRSSFVVILPSLIFPFLFGGALGGRVSSYFYLFFLFLIPQILSYCNKYIRFFFMLIICIYFFGILYISDRLMDKPAYTPYITIFQVDLNCPKFKS